MPEHGRGRITVKTVAGEIGDCHRQPNIDQIRRLPIARPIKLKLIAVAVIAPAVWVLAPTSGVTAQRRSQRAAVAVLGAQLQSRCQRNVLALVIDDCVGVVTHTHRLVEIQGQLITLTRLPSVAVTAGSTTLCAGRCRPLQIRQQTVGQHFARLGCQQDRRPALLVVTEQAGAGQFGADAGDLTGRQDETIVTDAKTAVLLAAIGRFDLQRVSRHVVRVSKVLIGGADAAVNRIRRDDVVVAGCGGHLLAERDRDLVTSAVAVARQIIQFAEAVGVDIEAQLITGGRCFGKQCHGILQRLRFRFGRRAGTVINQRADVAGRAVAARPPGIVVAVQIDAEQIVAFGRELLVNVAHVLASHPAVARPVARVFAERGRHESIRKALGLQKAVDIEHRDQDNLGIFQQILVQALIGFVADQRFENAGDDFRALPLAGMDAAVLQHAAFSDQTFLHVLVGIAESIRPDRPAMIRIADGRRMNVQTVGCKLLVASVQRVVAAKAGDRRQRIDWQWHRITQRDGIAAFR